MSTGFVLPRLDRPSGGNTYNANVLRHWPDGDPPVPEQAGTADELAAALRRHPVCIVDGLVASTDPGQLTAAEAAGHRIVLLVHMTQPADEPAALAAEAAAVRPVSAVVVPSRHTADILARRYGRRDAVVARPGATRVESSAAGDLPHDPPTVLQVGAIGPLKNQRLTLAAIAACDDLPVALHLVGPVVDRQYADDLQRLADAMAPGRVRIDGVLHGERLERSFAGADLLVSVAVNEAYGLVVTEALAHGVPVLAGRGTGAAEALRAGGGLPGAEVAVDDPGELAAALRRWLTDPQLRTAWRSAAVTASAGLPSWSRTAQTLAQVCRRLHPG